MSKETTSAPEADNATEMADSPLIAKLKKRKAEKSGDNSAILPETGLKVTWPKFQSHGAWMKAQRLAKKDFAKATNLYLTGICRFDGEKMNITDFLNLIPMNDVLFLTNEVIGGEDDEEDDDEGNVVH